MNLKRKFVLGALSVGTLLITATSVGVITSCSNNNENQQNQKINLNDYQKINNEPHVQQYAVGDYVDLQVQQPTTHVLRNSDNENDYEYHWFIDKEDGNNVISYKNYTGLQGKKVRIPNLSDKFNGSNFYCLVKNKTTNKVFLWHEKLKMNNSFVVSSSNLLVNGSSSVDGYDNQGVPVYIADKTEDVELSAQPNIDSKYVNNLKFQWYRADSLTRDSLDGEPTSLESQGFKEIKNENDMILSLKQSNSRSRDGIYACKIWLEHTGSDNETSVSEQTVTKFVRLNTSSTTKFKRLDPKVEITTSVKETSKEPRMNSLKKNDTVKITPKFQTNSSAGITNLQDIESVDYKWFENGVIIDTTSDKGYSIDSNDGTLTINKFNSDSNSLKTYKCKTIVNYKNGGHIEFTSSYVELTETPTSSKTNQIVAVWKDNGSIENHYLGENLELEVVANEVETNKNLRENSLTYKWYSKNSNSTTSDWTLISSQTKSKLSINSEDTIKYDNHQFKCEISNSSSTVELISSPIKIQTPKFASDSLQNRTNISVGSTLWWNSDIDVSNEPRHNLNVEWKKEYTWLTKQANSTWKVEEEHSSNFVKENITKNDDASQVMSFVSINTSSNKNLSSNSVLKPFKYLGTSTISLTKQLANKIDDTQISNIINNIIQESKLIEEKTFDKYEELILDKFFIDKENVQYLDIVKSDENLTNNKWDIIIKLTGQNWDPKELLNTSNVQVSENNSVLTIKDVDLNTQQIKVGKSESFNNISLLNEIFDTKFYSAFKTKIQDNNLNNKILEELEISSRVVEQIQFKNTSNQTTDSNVTEKYRLDIQLKNGYVLNGVESSKKYTNNLLSKEYSYNYTYISPDNGNILSEDTLNSIAKEVTSIFVNSTQDTSSYKYDVTIDNNKQIVINKQNKMFSSVKSANKLGEFIIEFKNPKEERTYIKNYDKTYVYSAEFKPSKAFKIDKFEQVLSQYEKSLESKIKNNTMSELNTILSGKPGLYKTFEKYSSELIYLGFDYKKENIVFEMSSRVLSTSLKDIQNVQRLLSEMKIDTRNYHTYFASIIQGLNLNNKYRLNDTWSIGTSGNVTSLKFGGTYNDLEIKYYWLSNSTRNTTHKFEIIDNANKYYSLSNSLYDELKTSSQLGISISGYENSQSNNIRNKSETSQKQITTTIELSKNKQNYLAGSSNDYNTSSYRKELLSHDRSINIGLKVIEQIIKLTGGNKEFTNKYLTFVKQADDEITYELNNTQVKETIFAAFGIPKSFGASIYVKEKISDGGLRFGFVANSGYSFFTDTGTIDSLDNVNEFYVSNSVIEIRNINRFIENAGDFGYANVVNTYENKDKMFIDLDHLKEHPEHKFNNSNIDTCAVFGTTAEIKYWFL